MFELDDAVFKRSHKVLERALKNGKHLPRAELRRKLNESGVTADHSVRLGHILIRAELDRVVCSGPRIGKQLTYALFDERVPETRPIDRDEALARLTRLYLQSHGPAMLQDFVWWSGLTNVEAKRGLEVVDVKKVSIDEKVYFSLPTGDTAPDSLHSAHLLPAFDEYFVAYKDRQPVFDSDNRGLTASDVLGPTVIVGGTVAGRWKKTKSIEVKFTRAVKKTERVAVEQATARCAAFLFR